ncbi:MAG: ion transporter, partial [Mesorhizobium sp.]|nr:ion transporter [Mesorhizobium sp.]
MAALKSLIESRRFDLAITVLIVLNAITLGLETSDQVMEAIGPALV